MSITHLPTNELVIDSDRMELLRKTIANGAPQLEFEMFVADCNRRGLDPFARQTYLIKRGDKWQQQTGIDGFRLIADRTGKYAGSDEAIYAGDIGEFPDKASVTVWKLVSGQRCPFTASARWDEYYPGDKMGHMWRKMPYVMLAKCAESLALRKAFPQELSGLYTAEEMQQADAPPTGYFENDPIPRPDAIPERVDTDTGEIVDADRDKAMKHYFAFLNERGITDDERKALQRIWPGVESAKEMTTEQITKLANRISLRTNEELRQMIAEAAQKRASASKGVNTTTDTFDAESATQQLLTELQAATTQEEVQAIGRSAAAMGLHTPELTKATAAAFKKFRNDDAILDTDKPLKLA